jgi:hypothetical protein
VPRRPVVHRSALPHEVAQHRVERPLHLHLHHRAPAPLAAHLAPDPRRRRFCCCCCC